ncbi:Uracil-DNA glycosylase family protein [Sulfidibacter corallicola]|uniref:Uracil-DNA glycosylase family protein n=1 Tax=Sulfidibacter corallicola TaxID=2818388 RepID=A0A8A4TFQ7_SULCO|nr:uracil-DNA glycosylase family protein [Sulfidibacter corallicola]QTD47591.1 uracil-DNA glycosylase family protein [Sulfidibacter corallicola]
MDREARRLAFRSLAAELDKLDLPVYESFGKDPLEPIIGFGPAQARLCIFGRDPGREEVRHGMPFVGAGGQKVRAELYRAWFGTEMPDFEASIAIGDNVFWANTMPYKPLGNKAWSQAVKKRGRSLMADVLLHEWTGEDVVTLGREAFLWFGIGVDRAARKQLEAFWQREDRFETSFEWTLQGEDGEARTLRLHPLPHPSPLNATWYRRFPELLAARLGQLAWGRDRWERSPSPPR